MSVKVTLHSHHHSLTPKHQSHPHPNQTTSEICLIRIVSSVDTTNEWCTTQYTGNSELYITQYTGSSH